MYFISQSVPPRTTAIFCSLWLSPNTISQPDTRPPATASSCTSRSVPPFLVVGAMFFSSGKKKACIQLNIFCHAPCGGRHHGAGAAEEARSKQHTSTRLHPHTDAHARGVTTAHIHTRACINTTSMRAG